MILAMVFAPAGPARVSPISKLVQIKSRGRNHFRPPTHPQATRSSWPILTDYAKFGIVSSPGPNVKYIWANGTDRDRSLVPIADALAGQTASENNDRWRAGYARPFQLKGRHMAVIRSANH